MKIKNIKCYLSKVIDLLKLAYMIKVKTAPPNRIKSAAIFFLTVSSI